jgi:hypothetical protein
MNIEIVLKNLYASEINCSISSFWDAGWNVKLGDEMNSFAAESNFMTEHAVWVAPRWEHRHDGYYFRDGRWR